MGGGAPTGAVRDGKQGGAHPPPPALSPTAVARSAASPSRCQAIPGGNLLRYVVAVPLLFRARGRGTSRRTIAVAWQSGKHRSPSTQARRRRQLVERGGRRQQEAQDEARGHDDDDSCPLACAGASFLVCCFWQLFACPFGEDRKYARESTNLEGARCSISEIIYVEYRGLKGRIREAAIKCLQ